MKTKRQLNPAVPTGAVLLLLAAASLLYILLPVDSPDGFVAEIFQDGSLIASIPLEAVNEPYTFTVSGADGGLNEIEVRHGSIGVISADCPDRLCVRQGFISDARLPVTCLPHRVVIRLRPADRNAGADDSITPDIITH